LIKAIGVGDNVVDQYHHCGMMFPGGNAVNFAVYGRRAGNVTAYVGLLADDVYGKMVADALTKEGVDFSRCVNIHGETGLCGTKLVDGDRIITEDNDGGTPKKTPLKVDDSLVEYVKNFDVVHTNINGYIDDQLCKLRTAGVPLVYDFSDLWTGEDALLALCRYIDIAFFSGKQMPEEEIASLERRIIEHGCELAICTIGDRGAIVFDGKHFYRKTPYNLGAKIVDTLGAGDGFLTGFVTAYIEGRKFFDAVVEDESENYVTSGDREDYMATLIGQAMSAGNLLAAKNCMSMGAFGYGVPMR
jgi:sugar/nucleoside kinase (ribokinase family)